jgi:hypothetical protein
MTKQRLVLLLNDTDEGGTHFGCMRVMRTIRAELAQRGMTDLPSIKVGTDWRNDPRMTAMLDAAQLVVINGEGTLHHGKRRGRWLLEAGARVKARGGRVALINALWQDNPAEWGDLARGFDLLACRDQRSAKVLAQQTGRDVHCMGDLSMFHPWPNPANSRMGITVGCSVHSKVTESLACLARDLNAEFLPVTTALKSVPARSTGLQRWLRAQKCAWHNWRFLSRHPGTRFVKDDLAYLQALSERSLLVTGRFHAVCLAVLSRTPFIATASNSWKIEALIADIGLNPMRAVPLAKITPEYVAQQDWAYSPAELAAIENSLARWRADGSLLFDQTAGLLTAHPTTSTGYSA